MWLDVLFIRICTQFLWSCKKRKSALRDGILFVTCSVFLVLMNIPSLDPYFIYCLLLFLKLNQWIHRTGLILNSLTHLFFTNSLWKIKIFLLFRQWVCKHSDTWSNCGDIVHFPTPNWFTPPPPFSLWEKKSGFPRRTGMKQIDETFNFRHFWNSPFFWNTSASAIPRPFWKSYSLNIQIQLLERLA